MRHQGLTATQDHRAEQTTQAHPLEPNLDTLVFVPEENIFCLVWRDIFPLVDPEADLEKIQALHIQRTEA